MNEADDGTLPDAPGPTSGSQPLVGQEIAFDDATDAASDPTTRRVSKLALSQLIAQSLGQPAVEAARPTSPEPAAPPSPSALVGLRRAREIGLANPGVPFGRYRLHGIIGRGGMAEVWLATERRPEGVRVAVVKVQHPELAGEPTARALFLEEGRISAQLRHANIVKLYERGDVDGRPYLAFELIDGISVRELSRLLHPRRLPLKAALEATAQAAAALAYAHGLRSEDGAPLEVVHRDVTPHNLLVDRTCRVKLVDFGIARFAGREALTRPGAVRGKLGYLAPEQLRGGTIDARTDLYALGLVILELAIGRPVLPFSFISIEEIERRIQAAIEGLPPEAPPELRTLLRSMTASKLEDRLDRAAEAEVRLMRMIPGLPDEGLAAFVAREIFGELPAWDDSGPGSAATMLEVTGRIPVVPTAVLPRPATPTYDLDEDGLLEEDNYGEALRRLRRGSWETPADAVSGHSEAPASPTEAPAPEQVSTIRLPPVLSAEPIGPDDPTRLPKLDPSTPVLRPLKIAALLLVVMALAALVTYWVSQSRF